jgi:predicted PolB exonuclease-like 3'-5' exonuclease
MTQLTHPKLTDRVIERFIKMYGEDKQKARFWLGETLGVGKTQMYDWAARIVQSVPAFNQAVKDMVISEVRKGGGVFSYARPSTPPVVRLKRLFWDIETSMTVVYSWGVGFKLNIGHESIIKERKIICIGYKWEGDDKVTVLRWDENQDDKQMLTEFLKVANEADELVAHNGDGFDMPWFRTRCIFHGLRPMPDYKTVDTCQWAKRYFYFQSNKLDYIAKYLGFGGKVHTTYGLWKEIVEHHCPEAMAKMCHYCGKDVVLLEKVWNKLREFVKPKTHAGVVQGRSKWTCAHCGSDHVTKSKTKVTAAGTVQHQMQCQECGGYTSINEAAFKTYKIAKKGGA